MTSPAPDAPDGAPRAGADRVITVVQHEDDVPLDRFADWLRPARLRMVRAYRGDPVPTDPSEVGDGLIVLGGTMDAYADDVARWLPATRALLAAVAGSGVPALGICLGAQLLAVACGGRVEVAAAAGRETGVVTVRWSDTAAHDELVGGVARGARAAAARGADPDPVSRFPTMHADAVAELPAGAVLLGSSAAYAQAFRVGSAWGVQFHPETSPETLRRWVRDEPAVDADAVMADYVRHDARMVPAGRSLARSFGALVGRGVGGPPPTLPSPRTDAPASLGGPG